MKTIAENANGFESIRTTGHVNFIYVDSNARGRTRGSILMETVIVMPVLLMLIFGIIQFAHIWTARQMVAYAAFCATRAIMVVPPGEQEKTAQNAAEVALSWINLVDAKEGKEVTVPGWGKIGGSGLSKKGDEEVKRVKATVLNDGRNEEVAAVEVTFYFPLIIPGMAVNKIIGNAWQPPYKELTFVPGQGRFYENLHEVADEPVEIDGWPYIELKETCVLPMPYSTERFPTGAFRGVEIRSGS